MKLDRRNLLRIALGGGALAMFALPEKWLRPVVNAVIVPAHAQASPGTTTSTSPGPSTTTQTTTQTTTETTTQTTTETTTQTTTQTTTAPP